eukprot:6189661-Pleurochrysis_carterae.AAC.3
MACRRRGLEQGREAAVLSPLLSRASAASACVRVRALIARARTCCRWSRRPSRRLCRCRAPSRACGRRWPWRPRRPTTACAPR